MIGRQDEKDKRNQRIHADEIAIKRQVKIAKAHGFITGPEHRLAKVHAATCGDSNCVMCGNPRKFFSELTKQEKSFIQTSGWIEDELND